MFSFPPGRKLKSSQAISSLFEQGKSLQVPPIRVLFAQSDSTDNEPWRCAFAVSKKNFPKAHDRNRLKRYMRESVRLQQDMLQLKRLEGKCWHILFIYNSKSATTFNELKVKFTLALVRLNKETERVS